jgi:hypothetical protein
MSDILQTSVCTYLNDREKRKFKMKFRRKLNGWVTAAFAVTLMTGSLAMAADGDPDAKQEVRAMAAISKLKKLENISLFYVKGMT